MGPSIVERFQNPPPAPMTVQMSPALANLLATPALVATATAAAPPQVDILGREQDIQDTASWTQVRNAINKRAECPTVGNTMNTTLEKCMEKCNNTEGCNIINYDSHTTDCMMQNCENPQNPPLKDGYDGTVWWNGRSGPKPNPGPNPGPTPDCPVCPDMSQYIRLDEVPCWNCSLP
jgi:hypothetical protein